MKLFLKYEKGNTYVDITFEELINLIYNYLTENKEAVYLDDIKFTIKVSDRKKKQTIKTTYTKLKKDLGKLVLIEPEFQIIATHAKRRIEATYTPDNLWVEKVGKEEVYLLGLSVIKKKKISLEKILKAKRKPSKLIKQIEKKIPKNKKKYLITTRECIDKIKTE